MIEKIKKYLFIIFGILVIFIIFSIVLFIVKISLGFSQEKFNELILAGLFQSILSGGILYFIFSELLVRRPRLRLYVEPNEIRDKEFLLHFYIKNIGDSNAKDALFIISFPDLEIIKEYITGEKEHKRIDYLYGNTSTIQINFNKPIYQHNKANQPMADISFRFKKIKDIEMRYSIEAENMDYFEGSYKIPINIKT